MACGASSKRHGTVTLLACVVHLAHTLPRKLVFGLFDHTAAGREVLVTSTLMVENGGPALPGAPVPGLGIGVGASRFGVPVAERIA